MTSVVKDVLYLKGTVVTPLNPIVSYQHKIPNIPMAILRLPAPLSTLHTNIGYTSFALDGIHAPLHSHEVVQSRARLHATRAD